MKSIFRLLICVFLLILGIAACSTARDKSQNWNNEANRTVIVKNVTLSLLGARLRSSVQTHYLMHYPEPQATFLELILTIDGIDATPEETLQWGVEI